MPTGRLRCVAAGLLFLAACTGGGKTGPSPTPTLLPAPPSETTPARKPNIVLVLTDDQRWDTLDVMPTVERELAGKGVTFTDAVVVNPVCCPSRTSILTGQYSHTTGVYTNTPDHGGFNTFNAASTIATQLHDDGYRTALMGKYLNGYDEAYASYVAPGWDRWFAEIGQGYYDYDVSDDGLLRSFGSSPQDYSTDVLAGEAVKFVQSTRDRQPLFLYFAPHAPHSPSIPAPGDQQAFSDLRLDHPASYNEADVSDKPDWVRKHQRLTSAQRQDIDRSRRDMLRSLLGVDRAVGKILAALSQAHRLDNTLFVFTSDNGFLWGEHRLSQKNAPYEESIRVPMIVRFDPWVSGSREDSHLVANIDLAPTFAASAGIAAPEMDGLSLLPLLRSSAAPWRKDVLIEHLESMDKVPTFCAVRGTRYIYVAYQTGEQELYDLSTDPYELNNRAKDPALAPTVTAMHDRTDELCYPTPPGFTLPP